MIDSWKGVAAIFVVALTAVAVILGLSGVVYLNAQHKRDLMRDCLSQQAPARTPADCHNGIYGIGR